MTPTAQSFPVCAGSPSPVDDGQIFDMASHLVRHPYDTFYVVVSGDSMIEAGIQHGDILVVDKSLEPKPSDIVVAQTGGGFSVKRFSKDQGRLRLVPANPDYQPIELDEESRICGVATFVIHKL